MLLLFMLLFLLYVATVTETVYVAAVTGMANIADAPHFDHVAANGCRCQFS